MVSIITIEHKYIYLVLIICVYAMNWFQELLLNTAYSIQYYSLISSTSNSCNYCYVTPIILFCIQVNGFKYYIQIILFAHS